MCTHVASPDVRFLPNTFHILSIYYLFRREKSRHVENRIAWLVTRLQFLNYVAIICLFPAILGAVPLLVAITVSACCDFFSCRCK